MDRESVISKAKELKEKDGVDLKVVRVGLNHYALKSVTVPEFLEYRNVTDITEEIEKAFLIGHIAYPPIDINIMDAGTYEKLKEALFTASGFSQDVELVYDPTTTQYIKPIDEIIKIIDATGIKNYKIILINRIPFVIRPIVTEEYIDYRSNTETLLQVPEEMRFKKAAELDSQFAKDHILYPENMPNEAGYLENIFAALWKVSGFSQDVEIVEI